MRTVKNVLFQNYDLHHDEFADTEFIDCAFINCTFISKKPFKSLSFVWTGKMKHGVYKKVPRPLPRHKRDFRRDASAEDYDHSQPYEGDFASGDSPGWEMDQEGQNEPFGVSNCIFEFRCEELNFKNTGVTLVIVENYLQKSKIKNIFYSRISTHPMIVHCEVEKLLMLDCDFQSWAPSDPTFERSRLNHVHIRLIGEGSMLALVESFVGWFKLECTPEKHTRQAFENISKYIVGVKDAIKDASNTRCYSVWRSSLTNRLKHPSNLKPPTDLLDKLRIDQEKKWIDGVRYNENINISLHLFRSEIKNLLLKDASSIREDPVYPGEPRMLGVNIYASASTTNMISEHSIFSFNLEDNSNIKVRAIKSACILFSTNSTIELDIDKSIILQSDFNASDARITANKSVLIHLFVNGNGAALKTGNRLRGYINYPSTNAKCEMKLTESSCMQVTLEHVTAKLDFTSTSFEKIRTYGSEILGKILKNYIFEFIVQSTDMDRLVFDGVTFSRAFTSNVRHGTYQNCKMLDCTHGAESPIYYTPNKKREHSYTRWNQ
jgi:hypothetical protein